MNNLKAWVENPDDWKIEYTPKPIKSLKDKLISWIAVIGFILFVMVCNAVIELIC